MAAALTPSQIADLKARFQGGSQAYLNAVAASRVTGPRGPNPYDCPVMGSQTVMQFFTRAQAERFFAPVIWGYVRDAIVAGASQAQTPQVKFTPMLTGMGVLWPNFDTYPLRLPVNDQFYSAGSGGPVKGGAPQKLATGTLAGLGAVPELVTIPGSGGLKGYRAPDGRYVIPGNTNGHAVDAVNWLWWAYVNGKVTCSKAWGSSSQLKAWGAPFKGYSSFVDKVAPAVIEALVIAGVTYGFASAAGAGAEAGGGSGVEATPASAYTPAAAGAEAAPTLTTTTIGGSTLAPVGIGTATAGVPAAAAAAAGGGGGVLSTVGTAVSAVGTGAKLLGTAVGTAAAVKQLVSGSSGKSAAAPGAPGSAAPSSALDTAKKLAVPALLGIVLWALLA